MKLALPLLGSLLLLVTQSGCGLLLGNVKPVDEKSEDYGVLDLSRTKPDEWTKLDPSDLSDSEPGESDKSSTEVSDTVFQSRKTAATISLNSACRPRSELQSAQAEADSAEKGRAAGLRKVTNLLLLGLSDVTLRNESELKLQGRPALQTTIRGKLNGEDVMLRTVVTRKEGCTYDLVYLAPPEHFGAHLEDFSQFVASLRLK
jgi:hypothetical protein